MIGRRPVTTKKRAAVPAASWRSRIVDHAHVPPADLVPNPRNWRARPADQQGAFTGALTEVGWVAEVLVNRTTGHVVDGHLRVEPALAHREPSVPDVRRAHRRASSAWYSRRSIPWPPWRPRRRTPSPHCSLTSRWANRACDAPRRAGRGARPPAADPQRSRRGSRRPSRDGHLGGPPGPRTRARVARPRAPGVAPGPRDPDPVQG